MAVMIPIRNVPDEVHRALKARSALAGKSLSELILDELIAMTNGGRPGHGCNRVMSGNA
jgi:plasmid stability protein